MLDRNKFCQDIQEMTANICYRQLKAKGLLSDLSAKETASNVLAMFRDPLCIIDLELARVADSSSNLPREIGTIVGKFIDAVRPDRTKQHEHERTVKPNQTRAEAAAALTPAPTDALVIQEQYDMVCNTIQGLPEDARKTIAADQIYRNHGHGMFKTIHDCGVQSHREEVIELVLTVVRQSADERRPWYGKCRDLYEKVAGLVETAAVRVASRPAVVALLVSLMLAADAFASKVH